MASRRAYGAFRNAPVSLEANGIERGKQAFSRHTAATNLDLVCRLSFALSDLDYSEIMSIRVLEIIFFFYFASHIPITLFIDLQALLPGHMYPQPVSFTSKLSPR